MAYNNITVETKDFVTVVTLNRPPMNSINLGIREELDQLITDVQTSRDTRVVIITGAGEKAFCAGMDVSDVANIEKGPNGIDIYNKIERSLKPVIAVINGHALGGGCELAMACHIRFMKKGARIGLTETNLGIMPGYGGSLRLPRLVGKSKALEMIFLGKQCEADEALAIGLVDHVTEENVLDAALELANKIAKRAPLAVAAVTKLCNISQSMAPDLHLKIEREELGKLFNSKDAQEGIGAFFEKREANFKGE